MMKYILFTVILIIAFTIVYADSPSPKGILEESCHPCHNINIVLKANKNEDEWQKTLDRMNLYGAKLNEEEREVLIEFLKNN